MRNDQININQLLDKYSNGEITPAERHMLEKEALDDHFLFDAIEGFSKSLENKALKVKSKKLWIDKLLPYAAVAALTIGMVAVYMMQGDYEDKVSDIAMALPQATTVAPPIPDNNAEVQNENESMSGVQQPVKTESAQNKEPKTKYIAKGKDKLLPKKKEEKILADVSESRRSDKSSSQENEASKMAVQKPLFDQAKVAQPSPPPAGPTQNMGLSAGADSSYKSKNENNVTAAFPAMGTEAFNNFIKRNVVKPSDSRFINFSDEVEVKFRINEDGSLSHFIIQSTECMACGEEAIRVLKNSGKWITNPKGIQKETSVRVKF